LINGAHMLVFSADSDADRDFFRDTLGLPWVDAGGGWLIYALPPSELALHPAEQPRHELYLLCDDVHATVDELKRKGVEFTREISEERWGIVTALRLPSGGELALYEPRHPQPPGLGG
jgi:hypothetical protein